MSHSLSGSPPGVYVPPVFKARTRKELKTAVDKCSKGSSAPAVFIPPGKAPPVRAPPVRAPPTTNPPARVPPARQIDRVLLPSAVCCAYERHVCVYDWSKGDLCVQKGRVIAVKKACMRAKSAWQRGLGKGYKMGCLRARQAVKAPRGNFDEGKINFCPQVLSQKPPIFLTSRKHAHISDDPLQIRFVA